MNGEHVINAINYLAFICSMQFIVIPVNLVAAQGRAGSGLKKRSPGSEPGLYSMRCLGYAFLRVTNVNLIFLDVYLGDCNTLEAIPRLKGLAIKSAIAVMTAGTQDEAIEKTLKAARESEADFVLRKPFDSPHVKAIIGEVSKDQKLGRRRPHALVVDDCRFVRHLTVGTLDDNGFRVTEAKTMEEALKNPEIARVDVVITDIFMPGMGGIEGTKIIKSTWPRVKVIAMSAGIENRMPSEKVLRAAREIGADAELNKPFVAEDLLKMTLALVA